MLGWGEDFEKWWVSRRVSKGASRPGRSGPVPYMVLWCLLNFVKALSRYALLKARYSVEDPFFEILRFGLRLKFDLVSEPNPIWSQNQIRFGLGTKSDLVSEPNPIWSRNQIPFGLGTKFDLVSDPTRIWSRTQLGFGLGPWFVGTWLLWRWLLRSYLEPGYTEHKHFVVFNIGDKPKIYSFNFFLYLTI